MTREAEEGVLDRLIQALAAQLDASARPALTPAAAEALAELSRAEANLIFSAAGHLVHYGADTDQLELLIQLVSDIQRDEAPAEAAIVAGDEVRLVGEPPPSLAAYDPNWLRETVFVVRYVGDDATVDVQPELWSDYVIETVPIVLGRVDHDDFMSVQDWILSHGRAVTRRAKANPDALVGLAADRHNAREEWSCGLPGRGPRRPGTGTTSA